MLEKKNTRFHEQISTEGLRSQASKKYWLFCLLHLVLALLMGIAAAVLSIYSLWTGVTVCALLAIENLILAARCDILDRLMLAVSYLDRKVKDTQPLASPALQILEEPATTPFPEETAFVSDIITPALEGIQDWFDLREWKVADGTLVTEGDVVAELENDDIIIEVEVMDSGRIARAVAEGHRMKVGTVLATLAVEAS